MQAKEGLSSWSLTSVTDGSTPSRDLHDHCLHCCQNFSNPRAKFCRKCGTRRETTVAAAAARANKSNPYSATGKEVDGGGGGGGTSSSTTERSRIDRDDDDLLRGAMVTQHERTASSEVQQACLRRDDDDGSMETEVGGAVETPLLCQNASSGNGNSGSSNSSGGVTAAMCEPSTAGYPTLSDADVTGPEMLQTSNAEELRLWRSGPLLGRGTFGSVYLGLMPSGAFRAVKVVILGRKSDGGGGVKPQELATLSREILLMSRLQHKNLCRFYGAYYDAHEGAIKMVMEYVAGGSLASLVHKFKPLPPTLIRQWTAQLLHGLEFLHSNRIMHRDIKGENILIDVTAEPSSAAQVKLVDFGAAKRLSDAVSHSKTVVGTPMWMAPEVIDFAGDGPGYSYKADVWSVGCTVAEMIAGKPPWPSRPNIPSAIMMIAQSPNGPTEIPEAESTPGALDFMRQCFIRDPAQRPTVELLLQHPWILGAME